MAECSGEVLTAPLQFFVEAGTYATMTGQEADPKDLHYKKFQSTSIYGAP